MRKFLLLLGIMGIGINAYAGTISVDPFLTPDDVTIAHLETQRTKILNAINGNISGGTSGNIGLATVADANMADDANVGVWFGKSFNGYVYTGLLAPTSASLVSTTTTGVAFIKDTTANKTYYVSKADTAHTYTASKWTYVDLSNTGVYTYIENAIGAAEPATTTNSLRLFRVSSDATTINTVRDDRVLSIALAGNENFERSGLKVKYATTTTLTISSGSIRVGSTFLQKLTTNTLTISTGTDWANGVSGVAANAYGYVGIDNNGNLKLIKASDAPTCSDSSGNTTGTLRYSVVATVYYRIIGWFYLNASSQLTTNEVSNFKDGDVNNIVMTRFSDDAQAVAGTVVAYVDVMNVTTDIYLSSGSNLQCMFNGYIKQAGTIAGGVFTAFEVDGNISNDSEVGAEAYDGSPYAETLSNSFLLKDLAPGTHRIKVKVKIMPTSANSIVFYNKKLIVEEK
jgi:hypothetical protein